MTFAEPSDLASVLIEPTESSELQVYLMQLPDGRPVSLSGVSALIWLIAAEGDDDVAAAVANSLDMEVLEIRNEVETFLDDLLSRGLLVRAQ